MMATERRDSRMRKIKWQKLPLDPSQSPKEAA